MHAPAPTTVYFDGSCPLCRREIAVYRRAVPLTPIDWVDVSTGSTCGIDGRSCGDLMTRFHVRTADGRMLSGAAAFVALWLLFPGWADSVRCLECVRCWTCCTGDFCGCGRGCSGG